MLRLSLSLSLSHDCHDAIFIAVHFYLIGRDYDKRDFGQKPTIRHENDIDLHIELLFSLRQEAKQCLVNTHCLLICTQRVISSNL